MQNIISKINNRVKNEVRFARLAYYTKFVYNKRSATGCMNPAPKGEFCDLAVVSFNNAKVIEYQILALAKFFIFPFRYTVFDNSSKEDKAVEIQEVCKRHGVGYIRLPKQEFLPKGCGSYSHGIACNYLNNNYIAIGGANILAFLTTIFFL